LTDWIPLVLYQQLLTPIKAYCYPKTLHS